MGCAVGPPTGECSRREVIMEEGSSVFPIICECCGAKIHVDGKTRTVFYTEKEGMKKRSFEEVVEDVTSVGQRAAEKFRKGMEKEANRDQELDALFEKAKKKARENPDKKPPSIWDYD